MLKKVAALVLAVLMSIDCFAAIVSDNDGSAFVTKKEFEDLKSNFNTQVEQYNTSIDSKIDGAIANYLNGVRVSHYEKVPLNNTFTWKFPIICLNNSEWNQRYSSYYSYEMPDLKNIGIKMRTGTDDWNSPTQPSLLDIDATSALSSNRLSTMKAVCIAKNWYVTPVKYSEMIEISDVFVNRQISVTSEIKCYQVKNVGKGRHTVTQTNMGGGYDSGHINTSKRLWGYTGILGIGVSGSTGTRATFTTSSYANWTSGVWKRTSGESLASIIGWGAVDGTSKSFVLPADNLNLNGALTWANNYTNMDTKSHGKCYIGGVNGGNTKVEIKWLNDNSNHRSWVFSGDSDAPATTPYGWYFNCEKPSSATEQFEGYIMNYENDLGMAPINNDDTWWGFHSWTPHWYWKYTAGGTIGTNPSTSEFSKLPAKQIFYYDENKDVHYFDEGLFLFNMPGIPEKFKFSAKWSVLDPTVTTSQKIKLKISSTPFGVNHDSTTNLKYTVDGGTESADQQVVCGASKKIEVTCDETIKQVYMMWEPVTSGTYLGLSELSDFQVLVE